MRRNAKLMISAGTSQSLNAPIEFPCDGYISNVEIQFLANIGASPLSENPFMIYFGDYVYTLPVLDDMVMGNTEQLEIEADLRNRGFLLKYNQAYTRKEYETATAGVQMFRWFVVDPVKRYKPWAMFVKKSKKYSLKALSDGEEPFTFFMMKFAFSPKKGAVFKQKVQETNSFSGNFMIPYDMKNAKINLDFYLAETAAAKDVRLFAHIIRKGSGDITNFSDAHDITVHGAMDEPYVGDSKFPFAGHDVVLDHYVHGPSNEGSVINDLPVTLGDVKAGDIVKFVAYDITDGDGTKVTTGMDWSYDFSGIIAKDYYCKEGVFHSVTVADIHNVNLNEVGGAMDV